MKRLCKCGHSQREHIREEGACRPGFVCAEACESYTPESSGRGGLTALQARLDEIQRRLEAVEPVRGNYSLAISPALQEFIAAGYFSSPEAQLMRNCYEDIQFLKAALARALEALETYSKPAEWREKVVTETLYDVDDVPVEVKRTLKFRPLGERLEIARACLADLEQLAQKEAGK